MWYALLRPQQPTIYGSAEDLAPLVESEPDHLDWILTGAVRGARIYREKPLGQLLWDLRPV